MELDTNLRRELSTVLECPVCLNVPRELPIPACSAGHILCRSCRSSVTSCPTCRRSMDNSSEITNSIAAALIDKVPHKCKYSEYGCQVQDLLTEVMKHEEKCPDRTVTCPYCKEKPQLRKYHNHAVENCSVYQAQRPSTTTPLSYGFLKWNGINRGKLEEFDLTEDQSWFSCYTQLHKKFYLLESYVPAHKCFTFVVYMAENKEDVGDYSVQLTIPASKTRENLQTIYRFPVIGIEEFPKSNDKFMFNNQKCCHIPYTMMRNFFKIKDIGENNNHTWEVTYCFKLEITKVEPIDSDKDSE